MVIETLNWLVETSHIEVIVVEVKYPMDSPSDLVDSFSKAIESYGYGDVKLCIFSHISSLPTMIEPVAELSSIAHAHGSLVLVDGAHAPGVIPIDVKTIACDFYTGNCHKWLYTPKGSAFMWVHRSQQSETFPEPTVISSSGVHDFIGRYVLSRVFGASMRPIFGEAISLTLCL